MWTLHGQGSSPHSLTRPPPPRSGTQSSYPVSHSATPLVYEVRQTATQSNNQTIQSAIPVSRSDNTQAGRECLSAVLPHDLHSLQFPRLLASLCPSYAQVFTPLRQIRLGSLLLSWPDSISFSSYLPPPWPQLPLLSAADVPFPLVSQFPVFSVMVVLNFLMQLLSSLPPIVHSLRYDEFSLYFSLINVIFKENEHIT